MLSDDSRIGNKLMCSPQSVAEPVDERVVPVQGYPALHQEYIQGMPLPYVDQFVLQHHFGQCLCGGRKNVTKKRSWFSKFLVDDERTVAQVTLVAFLNQADDAVAAPNKA